MAVRSIAVRLAAEVSNYVQGFQRAKAATGDLIGELSKSEQQRQQFQQLGTGMLVAGGAIAAGMGLATKAAIDWESAWAGVVKTVDGSDAQLALLEEELREMARTLPATHAEIAGVAEAAGQLGVATEDVSDFTRTMIDMGEATNLTAEEAAVAIAQMANVMGTATSDVDRLGASVVALGNNSATTEADIIAMAQRIAGAGATIGLSEAQVIGFSAALASVGINAEAGGSAISRAMISIEGSVRKGGDELEALAEVAGMSAADFQEAYERDAAQAIATFIAGLGRMQESGQDVFATLEQLGFTEIRLRDALLRLASSGDLLTTSLETGNQAWDENLALTEEASRRYETAESRIQIAKNQLNDFAIDVGATFLPVVAEAADKLGGFVEFLGDLPDPLRNLVVILGAAAGAILLLGGTAVTAITRIAAYREAIRSLNAAGGTTAVVTGRITRGLQRGMVVAGKATAAIAALHAAGAILNSVIGDSPARVDALALSIQRLSASGQVGGEVARVYGDDLDRLGKDLQFVANMGGRADLETGAMVEGLGLGIPVMKAFSGSAQSVSERMEALEGALTQMAQAGGPELAAVLRFLEQQADQLGVSVDELVQTHFPELAAVLETVADESGATGSSVSELGDIAGDTADDVEALADAFDRLFGIQMDIDRATIAYKQGLRDLKEELEDGTRTLDVNSQAGRDNRGAVLDQIDAIADLRQANIDNGASIEEANDKYDDQLDKLEEILVDRGFEEEAVRDLIDAYREIPELALTEVEQPGMDKALEESRLYNDLLFLIGDTPRLRTIMQLPNIEDRIAALKDYREWLNRIDGRVVTSTVRTINENITRDFGVNAPQVRRHGGITLHAQHGLLRDANVFPPVAPARFAFAEPETGGEAFIPKRGDRQRSLAIADIAAGWHGGRVVAGDGATVGGRNQWHGARPVTVAAADGLATASSRGGRSIGGVNVEHQEVHVQAFTDRFSMRQVMEELAFEGAS